MRVLKSKTLDERKLRPHFRIRNPIESIEEREIDRTSRDFKNPRIGAARPKTISERLEIDSTKLRRRRRRGNGEGLTGGGGKQNRIAGGMTRETKRLISREGIKKSINRYYYFFFYSLGHVSVSYYWFHTEVHNTLHCVCPLFDSTFCSNIKNKNN